MTVMIKMSCIDQILDIQWATGKTEEDLKYWMLKNK